MGIHNNNCTIYHFDFLFIKDAIKKGKTRTAKIVPADAPSEPVKDSFHILLSGIRILKTSKVSMICL